MGFRAWGLGFRVWGWGLGFRVLSFQGLGFGVSGLGFGVLGSWGYIGAILRLMLGSWKMGLELGA